MTGDSVAKTLVILFLIAVSPCILAAVVITAYVWIGLAGSHG